MPEYTELYALWYTEVTEDLNEESEFIVTANCCVGVTDNLDRAEAVEMFLVENGYKSPILETIHNYHDGTTIYDVFNKLPH
jgi:hypothetical protein